jgi:hypothetical protein
MGTGFAALGLAPLSASAAVDLPHSVTEPPRGAGTEQPTPARPTEGRVREGSEVSIQAGAGFTDTYGFGLGARYGYTFRQGIYVGAAGTYYWGNSVTTNTGKESAHAGFFGAEVGYKFFPEASWEIRPYVFGGPAFIREVNTTPFFTDSKTRFAVQPGILGAYHFGPAYITAEARLHATPSPTALTLLGGAGLSF